MSSAKPTLHPPASPSKPMQPLATLSPRPGSRSPTSIPSSPTSIRSASSAIFERDIEPLPSQQPPHHPSNPHRTPRSRMTETIEQSVPSVLAEAVQVLTETTTPPSDISVLAPVPQPSTLLSFAHNTSSLGSRSPPTIRSRSPSPSPARPSLGPRRLSAGIVTTAAPSGSPLPSPSAATTPLPLVPDASASSSPAASPRLRPLSANPPTNTPPSSYSPPPPLALHAEATNLALPSHAKRLSFISYSDLLTSTPIAAVPLTTLTAPPSGQQPPPHIPVVASSTGGVAGVLASPTATASVGAPSRPLSTYSVGGLSAVGGTKRNSAIHGVGDDLAQRLADDIGGEWEREGFGKGMEERLEEVGVGKA